MVLVFGSYILFGLYLSLDSILYATGLIITRVVTGINGGSVTFSYDPDYLYFPGIERNDNII